MQQKGAIQIIEWEDLDKRKFYSLGVFMTLTTRATVYPASLIRTRLQVQKGKALYSGTFDAFCKILRTEGLRGLYRGFMLNTFTLVSGQAYITTYELVRKYVSQYSPSNTVKSVVAGGAASLVAQTITVPIDVVSQHLMMQGQGEHLSRFKVKPKMMLATTKRRPTFGQTRDITVQIFAADGFKGFYRGYVASLLTYIPNSALWWPFYHFYAAVSASTKSLPPPHSAGFGGTNGSSNCLHHHKPYGCCSCKGTGGGTIISHRNVQAASRRGGRLGDDQGAVGPHHILHAHICAHRGRIRDPEEAEPACRADRVQTLVKDKRGRRAGRLQANIDPNLLPLFIVALLCSCFHMPFTSPLLWRRHEEVRL
ncbi:solute carrier family 25 member 44a isoform X1 [Melanotaenia boesemani]|uniref:solute carrier family 25 member 44a isoform X1 n=1 Tax=Melanotaenia boesemani TaxID=1250792 RepID=UPI001C049AD6|nr:solute carrier family 25 member 44a isoform X1 [Melanotaenia boesemani]XP_041853560.1 solute carrier family 25 member 44a isoform X1 [Melanotaenia boesemani]XP_041853561.1 solute carrier family 25 member 44a isoform X1 [Melanotaenia boesemani]